MALRCQVSLNYSSYTAGQSQPPMATVQVFNPNASAVVVTGITMQARTLGDASVNRTAMSPSVAPMGPGMTVTVPALSSITFGPFPQVVGTAANVNSFAAVNQTGNLNPIVPQLAMKPQFTVMVGAVVAGSDGSSNVAGEAALLVSYTSNPPLGFQGGFLQFTAPNNLAAALLPGVI